MIKHLLLSFYTAASGILFAQNYNVAGHVGIDQVGNLVAINSKSYYFSRNQSNCCSMQTVLYGCNSQAQPVFTTVIGHPGLSWDYPKKLIVTNDQQLLLLGHAMTSCDVGGYRDYIVKIDTLGNVLFHSYIQTSVGSAFPLGQIVDVVAYTNNSFYLVSADSLYHYSNAGLFISKISAGMININSMTLLNNGNLLVNGRLNNQLKNVEMDVSGTMLNQQASNSVITKFVETASGNLVGRTAASGLEAYSPTFTWVASGSLPGTVTDLVTRNDSVFVTGHTATQPFYAITNPAATLLYQTQATYKGIQPTGIAVTNKNSVAIISVCNSSIQPNVTFTGYYQLPLAGSFVSQADVGVKDMSLTSYSYSFASNGPGASYWVLPQFDFNIKIKNYSATQTLQSVYLNYFFSRFGCDLLFHKKYLLNLLPLDSVTVQTGMILAPEILVPANTQSSDAFYEQLCFFTTIPNASNDLDISNDAACTTITITGLTLGIRENHATTIHATFFPNPFSNQLNTDAEIEIKQLQVYNALGQLVHEEQPLAKSVALDMPALPAGIYMLRLQTEKGEVIKKVVRN